MAAIASDKLTRHKVYQMLLLVLPKLELSAWEMISFEETNRTIVSLVINTTYLNKLLRS